MRVRRDRPRLDRELADGLAPDGAEDRALRATQLREPAVRLALARALRDAVESTQRTPIAPLAAGVQVCPAVAECREGLLGLAERLELPGPINPCGAARVVVLLNDLASPLYNAASERSIGEALWWVADGLQPCPPHAWTCPVIMKLDPEHVAWTCGRCGKIAVTDDLSVRPA
jgi:hypothetical protein